MMNGSSRGVAAALASAVFLGLAPVFGKLAITLGFSPLAVVAWRTGLAALLVLIVITLFWRPFLYIFPAGLAGCLLAGAINGTGSILYYLALGRLTASVGQMLYSLYPFFVAIWLAFDGQSLGWFTAFRIGLAILGAVLLTTLQPQPTDLVGVLMMLGGAALYALHLPINQRVLYEVPAPTVTLYTLLAMSAIVVPVYLIFDHSFVFPEGAWYPVLGLTLVTALSRLALFFGVKQIGGMQAALLGLAELLVALIFSHLVLGETLLWTQWIGAAGLALSLVLVRYEKQRPVQRHITAGWFAWIRPPVIPRDAPWGPHE
jgi:drug/metabolite transporter (DMT)-like permease